MTDFLDIRRQRREKGWTGKDLATRASLSPATVSLIENGSGTLSSLFKIFNVLDLEFSHKSKRYGEPIGDFIRRAREKKKISQRELARRCGIAHSTLWALENDGIGQLKTLQKVLTVLKIDLEIAPKTQDDKNEWFTPSGFIDRVYKVFPNGFDLDAASPLVDWIKKARNDVEKSDGDKIIMLLVPMRITSYWYDDVFPYAHIMNIRERIKFESGCDQTKVQTPFNTSALVIFSTGSAWCLEKIEGLKKEFSECALTSPIK